MVYTTTEYHCDNCRKSFYDYDEARRCENDHIVQKAVDGFKVEIAKIFTTPRPTRQANRREQLRDFPVISGE